MLQNLVRTPQISHSNKYNVKYICVHINSMREAQRTEMVHSSLLAKLSTTGNLPLGLENKDQN